MVPLGGAEGCQITGDWGQASGISLSDIRRMNLEIQMGPKSIMIKEKMIQQHGSMTR